MKKFLVPLVVTVFTVATLSTYSISAHALFSGCKVDMHTTLDKALANTKKVLDKKRNCADDFEGYFASLVNLAEGYPEPANKQKFSDFLVWASKSGVVTRQRAEELYNRYFSVKFLAMMGDYNLCSSVCKDEDGFQRKLETELADKETGLLKVCRDNDAFARSNQLYSDSILVVNATCTACTNVQK